MGKNSTHIGPHLRTVCFSLAPCLPQRLSARSVVPATACAATCSIPGSSEDSTASSRWMTEATRCVTVEDFHLHPVGLRAVIGLSAHSDSNAQCAHAQCLTLLPCLRPSQTGVPSVAAQEADKRARLCVEQCRMVELFSDTKFLAAESLLALTHALASAAGTSVSADSASRGGRSGGGSADMEGALLCQELLILVTLRNRDRISVLWPLVLSHLKAVLGSGGAGSGGPLVERAAVGLLGLVARLLPYKEDLREELSAALKLFLLLDVKAADALMAQIAGGLLALVKVAGAFISASGWDTVGRLLMASARHPEAASAGFEALAVCSGEGADFGDSGGQAGGFLALSNFAVFVTAVVAFAEARAGGEQRSRRAVALLSAAALTLISWAGKGQDTQLLLPLWADLVASLRRCCVDERPEVRDEALVSLQRTLLASEPLAPPPQQWAAIIGGTLLPLLDALLDGCTRRSRDAGAERSLRIGLSLVAKTFLQVLSPPTDAPENSATPRACMIVHSFVPQLCDSCLRVVESAHRPPSLHSPHCSSYRRCGSSLRRSCCCSGRASWIALRPHLPASPPRSFRRLCQRR